MTIFTIIPLLAAIINAFLLIVVFVNRPWQKQHKSFMLYLAAAASWCFGNFLLLSSFFLDYKILLFRIVILSSVWMSVQLYYFLTSFVNLPGGFGARFGYVSLAILAVLAILGYAPTSIVIEEGIFVGPSYGWWFIFYVIPIIIVAALAIRLLVKRFRILTDPRERNKILYLLTAVIILVIFGSVSMSPLTLAAGLPWGYIGALLSASILTYAVLKHELVSINSVLRRGLGLISLLVVGICIYGLIVYLIHLLLNLDLSFVSLTISTIIALIVAVLIYWIRPKLFSIVDQFFYKETYAYRQVLLRFDREMGNIISLEELAERMLRTIASALRTSQVTIFFQDSGSGDFTTQYSHPKKKSDNANEQLFVHDSPIVDWLRKETNPLNLKHIENISQFIGLWQPERDMLVISNIELLCPIKSRGELIGILALSGKKGGGVYSQEDIEMITSMAGKAGIIIENARMVTILKQQQHQVQHLLNEAIQAQENERQRISADLHDSVAQWLAGASYQTQTVEALLTDTNNNDIRNQLNLVEETIDKSLTELRRVLIDLRPPSLDELGLSHSLRQSLTSISSNGLECSFHEEGNHTRLEPNVEITVYRVVQEALNNIRKHAEATRVDLYLSYNDDNVIVKIKDNGVGFDLTDTINNAISVGNLGILGMKQRVDMLGGNIDIQTRHGKGTTITLTLPLQPQIDES
ncbi:MAG: hypothetical protein A2158_02210 [Chloroflexi bacterium RBG_13_46_14]|nr:MAG: hypothetical protein A2158_02210 [Chloroflexi bacterium RBG_13_46_14]